MDVRRYYEALPPLSPLSTRSMRRKLHTVLQVHIRPVFVDP